MSNDSGAPWQVLFRHPRDTTNAVKLKMRLARKRGEPLLLLPPDPKLAATALTLYPAQSRRARLARGGLNLALQAGFSFGTTSVTLVLNPESGFAQFLFPSGTGPFHFAMLLGNPRSPGRRFVILLFDESG